VSGLVGDQEKGEKKRVAKLFEKIGLKQEKKKRAEQCVKCEKDAVKEFVECVKCRDRYHEGCHEPALKSSLVKKAQIHNGWECSDCKVCGACKTTNDEGKIIICDMCDQAVHIDCLKPPLSSVPACAWFCKDCS
jgi:hypothetical protein